MSEVNASLLRVSRVLHEDDDFITLEVAKNDDVTFHLQQNEQGETVGGDRFHTIVFVRSIGDGQAEAWLPWKEGDAEEGDTPKP